MRYGIDQYELIKQLLVITRQQRKKRPNLSIVSFNCPSLYQGRGRGYDMGLATFPLFSWGLKPDNNSTSPSVC